MAAWLSKSWFRCLGIAGIVAASFGSMPASATPVSPDVRVATAIAPMTSPFPSPVLLAQAEADIVDTAIAQGSFDVLIGLLTELGMAEDLRGYGRFTVFAPVDTAFAAVPESVMEVLRGDRELLARVLAYHVVASSTPYTSEAIETPLTLRTLERSDITLTSQGSRILVNGATVIDADIEASNGVIHAIDEVLIPEDVMAEILRRL